MTFPEESGTHDPPERPAYRVPIGMPLRDEGRRQGVVVSILVHGAIILLLLFPIVLSRTNIIPIQQGAGGAGPAGGGGGGRGGVQGMTDTIRFVRVSPTAIPTPTSLPPVTPAVTPKVAAPIPPVTPPPTPAVKPPEQAAAPPVASIAGAGTGPGTGNDGTTGNGPGSGGGVGSGVGTGRGSGLGPGTGGGSQANYPPTPLEFFLPPLPPPKSVKGFSFSAEFDVDSTGRVLEVKFTETRDGDYNKRLMNVLRSMRFRPGTRPDGTPLRMKAQLGYDF